MRCAFWQRLSQAESFVAVGKLVCNEAPALFGFGRCSVALRDPDGRPFLVIDNHADITDANRLAWVDGDLWRDDVLLQAIRDHRGPAGSDDWDAFRAAPVTGGRGHMLLLPLVEPGGIIGTIRCGRSEPFSDEVLRGLGVLGAHVSVRLAQLGVTTISEPAPLSPRQHQIARLAARGHPNHEIADVLAISENTVKKRLKEVFFRLEISNRTELGLALRPLLVTDGEAPLGISRDGALTITRGAPRRPAAARGAQPHQT